MLPQLVHKSSGQTLIEVMIALTISALVLGALITVVLNSLKNAQFAQNQTKATKYAQETIDQIRQIRDQDLVVTTSCISKFSNLWGYNLSNTSRACTPGSYSPCQAVVIPGGSGCYFWLSQTGPPYSLSEPSPNIGSFYYQPLDSTFTRLINLSDSPLGTPCPGSATVYCDYTNEKVLTVQIQWTDGAGTHQSNLQTILAPRI